jgi:hypothetical protein
MLYTHTHFWWWWWREMKGDGIYCRWFASKWDVFTMAVIVRSSLADASSPGRPKKVSPVANQPNSTLIRSSSSLVSQPGSIDLNLLYIPQHRRAIYFYTFFKEKIVSCIIFFVWTDQEQIRWAQCARLEKKERAVELNRIVKIKKK